MKWKAVEDMTDVHSACSTLYSLLNLSYNAWLLVLFLQLSFIKAALYAGLDVKFYECVDNCKRASSQRLQTFVYIDLLAASCQYM